MYCKHSIYPELFCSLLTLFVDINGCLRTCPLEELCLKLFHIGTLLLGSLILFFNSFVKPYLDYTNGGKSEHSRKKDIQEFTVKRLRLDSSLAARFSNSASLSWISQSCKLSSSHSTFVVVVVVVSYQRC